MQNAFQKTFTLFLIGIFFIPQVILAAWWNPLTWKNPNRPSEIKVEKPIISPAKPANSATQSVKKEPQKLNQPAKIVKPKIPIAPKKAVIKSKPSQVSKPKPITKKYSQSLKSIVSPSISNNQSSTILPSINNNGSSSVIEENFSDVAVMLNTAQLEALQSAMDTNTKAKNILADIKQTWNDELIKTQIYLNTYPNDSKLRIYAEIYDLLVQLSDNHIKQLDEQDELANKVKGLSVDYIVSLKNSKVLRNDIQSVFAVADKTAEFTRKYSDKISTLYKNFSAQHHDMAVRLDAFHSIEAAKKQREIDQTNALIAETNRTIEYARASMQQAQNELNSMRASQPTYCTATRTMPGSVSIVCN